MNGSWNTAPIRRPKRRVLGARRLQQVAALEQDLPADPRAAIEEIQDRAGDTALPGARLTDDAERLAWLQLERNIAHGRVVPP